MISEKEVVKLISNAIKLQDQFDELMHELNKQIHNALNQLPSKQIKAKKDIEIYPICNFTGQTGDKFEIKKGKIFIITPFEFFKYQTLDLNIFCNPSQSLSCPITEENFEVIK